MIRRILEAIARRGLRAYVLDPGRRIEVARVLHDAVPVIRGIEFEHDGGGWRMWAPPGADRAAFDSLVAQARMSAAAEVPT